MCNNLPDTAMIFAAGLGQRMLPLTNKTPKPMVKILGKPLIDYRLDKLVEAGVKRAVINTYHLAEILEEHLKKRNDIEIIISREDILLETGGGLVKARKHLGDKPIYIINCDVIWTDEGGSSLIKLAKHWNSQIMDELLLLQPIGDAIGYEGDGDFNLDKNGQLTRIGKHGSKNLPYIFTGIQIFEPSLLDGYPESPFSRTEIWKNKQHHNRMHGITHQGMWLHIDNIKAIANAEEILHKL